MSHSVWFSGVIRVEALDYASRSCQRQHRVQRYEGDQLLTLGELNQLGCLHSRRMEGVPPFSSSTAMSMTGQAHHASCGGHGTDFAARGGRHNRSEHVVLETLAGIHERLADGLARGSSHHAGGGEQHPAGIVRDFEGEAQALLRLGLRGDCLDGDLHIVLGFELGAAVGAVAFGNFGELVGDQFAQRRIGAKDTLQFRDFLLQGVALCFEFQAGVLGELAQAQLQNVVRLGVGQVEDDLSFSRA